MGTLFGPTVLVQAWGNRSWMPASPCLDLRNLSWSWTWQIWAPSSHLTYLWDPQNLGRQVGPEHQVHQQPLGRKETPFSLVAHPARQCHLWGGTLPRLLVASDPSDTSLRPRICKTPSVSAPRAFIHIARGLAPSGCAVIVARLNNTFKGKSN